MSLAPESPEYPRSLGVLYSGLGRWMDALRAYDKAVEISGRDTTYLMDLAFAFTGAGRAKSAVRVFEEVVEKDPGNLAAWMNIGLLAQEELRDREMAVRAYEAYLSHGGTDPRVEEWLEQVKDR
jgi:cytochrome c-type biogenesis protein CcmH/NrfG